MFTVSFTANNGNERTIKHIPDNGFQCDEKGIVVWDDEGDLCADEKWESIKLLIIERE